MQTEPFFCRTCESLCWYRRRSPNAPPLRSHRFSSANRLRKSRSRRRGNAAKGRGEEHPLHRETAAKGSERQRELSRGQAVQHALDRVALQGRLHQPCGWGHGRSHGQRRKVWTRPLPRLREERHCCVSSQESKGSLSSRPYLRSVPAGSPPPRSGPPPAAPRSIRSKGISLLAEPASESARKGMHLWQSGSAKRFGKAAAPLTCGRTMVSVCSLPMFAASCSCPPPHFTSPAARRSPAASCSERNQRDGVQGRSDRVDHLSGCA